MFTLNVLDELQDKFGDLGKFGEKLDGAESIKTLRWMLTLLINEGRDEAEPLTERQVGRLVDASEIVNVTNAVFRAINKGQTGNEINEADAGKKTKVKVPSSPI